jgi:hypothetical protein
MTHCRAYDRNPGQVFHFINVENPVSFLRSSGERPMRHTAWMIAAAGSMAAPAIAAPCDPGTYSVTGETPCITASPGHYVPGTGYTSQLAADPGTFVSGSGQSSAQLAPAGFYVSGSAATAATPASPGHFVPTEGQISQTPASAGHFVAGSGQTSQQQAGPGFYVPTTGAEEATPASPGHFVSGFGQTAQEAASPGFYVPTSGADSALPAPAGSYVATSAATAATPASLGHFVPMSGMTGQIAADPGFFVSATGQTSPQLAQPGYYVPTSGASEAIPATVGHFVSNSGSTSQETAAAGFYVPFAGSAAGIACGSGTESYGGAELCRITNPLATGGTGPNFVASEGSMINFGTVRLGSSSTVLLSLGNMPAISAIGFGITDLTLLSLSLNGGDFSRSGITPGLVLGDGDTAMLSLQFSPSALGLRSGLLTIQTDHTASFGGVGDAFSFTLSGQGAVPEPGTWMLLLTGFLGIGLIRRRQSGRTSPPVRLSA